MSAHAVLEHIAKTEAVRDLEEWAEEGARLMTSVPLAVIEEVLMGHSIELVRVQAEIDVLKLQRAQLVRKIERTRGKGRR